MTVRKLGRQTMSMRWRYLWAAWEVAAALSLSAAMCAGVVELVIGHHWIWLAVAAPGLAILAAAVTSLVGETVREQVGKR